MALFIRATSKKYLLLANNYCNKLTAINFKSKISVALSHNFVVLKFCLRHSRLFSTRNKKTSVEHGITSPFEDFLAKRKREARRSVIVQVQSPDSYSDLYSYCNSFGAINQMQHYVVNANSNFFLVEFDNIISQQSLMDSVTHINRCDIIPVASQMLWFRSVLQKSQKKYDNIPPMTQGKGAMSEAELNAAITSEKQISNQMQFLYNTLKLDDVGIRLRFLTALQMESSLYGLFPNMSVLPFGSSVNGFGRKNCDLDLVLNLELLKREQDSSRLVYHTKSAMSEERAQMKRSMEIIASLMRHFMPGIDNIKKILYARVPIIKYHHLFTGLECDLSMTNMTAIYMSELLFLFGESSDKVRPLVITVRQWASAVGITSTDPGPWITNFSLSLMVIFYLQTIDILPSLNYLKSVSRPSDKRVTETCVDCTFLRNINKWPVGYRRDDPLEMLLNDFFHFYASFDFINNALSLREGRCINKIDTSALYICNPLEKHLNVSKNVTAPEITRFVNSARNAAMLMDEGSNFCDRGLTDIFTEKQPTSKQFILGRQNKKLNFSTLFEEDIKTNINSNNSNNNSTLGDVIRIEAWNKRRARKR